MSEPPRVSAITQSLPSVGHLKHVARIFSIQIETLTTAVPSTTEHHGTTISPLEAAISYIARLGEPLDSWSQEPSKAKVIGKLSTLLGGTKRLEGNVKTQDQLSDGKLGLCQGPVRVRAEGSLGLRSKRYDSLRSWLGSGRTDPVILREVASTMFTVAEFPKGTTPDSKVTTFEFKQPSEVAEAIWKARPEAGELCFTESEETRRREHRRWLLGSHKVTFGNGDTAVGDGCLNVAVRVDGFIEFEAADGSEEGDL